MTATVAGIHLGIDTHANRPAGNAVPDGSLYSCSTHSKIYKSNLAGNSWADWGTLSGSGLSDPMTTRGDVIVRNASNVTDRLAIGATAGMVLGRTGSDAAYFLPPGYEFDYVAFTSNVNVTATSEATANTLVTGSSVTYDGSTAVIIEFYSPAARPDTGALDRELSFYLYDGSSSIGNLGKLNTPAAQSVLQPILARRRITPTNAAHTYSIRGSVNAGTGVVVGGAGGSTAFMPGYIRITKA